MRSMSHAFAGLLAGLLFLASAASAAEILLTPSVGVRTTWDDSTLGQGEADAELAISPAVKLLWRDELTQAVLNARLDAYQYLEQSDFARENAQLSLDVDRSVSERLAVRLDSRWVRDHTVEDEFTESGLTTEKLARNSFTASPGLTFRLTERDDLSLDLSGTLVRDEQSGSTNYDVLGLTAAWSHLLDDGRWRLLAQAGGQQYAFDRADGQTDQHVWTVQSGLGWKASELLEFQALAGVSLITSDVTFDQPVPGGGTDEQVIFSGALSGTWTDQIWRLTLGADRAESPSTYGELITRDRLRFTFSRNWSERLNLGLAGAYYLSRTSGLVRDQDTRTWTLGPTVRWKATEDATVDAGYSFVHEDDRETGQSTDRNRVYLGVTVEWPGQW